MGQRVRTKFLNKLKFKLNILFYSNLEGVGGASTINTAICPTGFVKFIDECILEVDNAPADFTSILFILKKLNLI